MPETAENYERILQEDGRYGWLLGGRQAWSVAEVAEQYRLAADVPVSEATVLRWFKRIAEAIPGGADNYGGTIGWRARRSALIQFFATRSHLRSSGDGTAEAVN